jgi:hypothetical protein
MNNEEPALEKRKNLLDALAPKKVEEAIGQIKKRLAPKDGLDLVSLAKTLVKRRSAKK